jgi:DNA-binding CsgD family transcriptional regulator
MVPRAERIRSLTPRQAEAIAWTWHGYTIAQLAAAMGCSYETARNHLHNGYIRLGIDRDGDDPAGCPRVTAAVALYRAVHLAVDGYTTGNNERTGA